MSNGGTTGSPKEHHVTKAKRENKEMKAEIEALKAQLANATDDSVKADAASVYVYPAHSAGTPPEEHVFVSDSAKDAEVNISNAPAPFDPNVYDKAADPIGFLADMDDVHLLSRTRAWPARRAADNREGKQNKTFQTALRARQWATCPFNFDDPDPKVHASNLYMNKEWWLHRITREFAEDVYAGLAPLLPAKSIVRLDDYDGVDISHRPKGTKSASSGDALVEYVRFCLQIDPKRTFFDTDRDVLDGKIDRSRPNPYGYGVAAQVSVTVRKM